MVGNIFEIPELKLLEFQLECKVQSSIIWNSFPGSVIHGALGFTMKQRCCVSKDEKCESCHFRYECAYPQLFESRVPDDSARMRKYPRIPPGLRLAVHPWWSTKMKKDDKINIGITLFGSAIQKAGPLLLTLEDAFQQGIGKKTENGQRGTAKIISISTTDGTQILWRDLDFASSLPFKVTNWSEITMPECSMIKLEFLTPTRIVSNGRVASAPSFKDIFSTVLRRVTNIAYFYSDLELKADFRELISKAESVIFQSKFHRYQQVRYSSKQKTRMEMAGIRGQMTLFDCPPELLNWLQIGAKLGIGKNTSMGMGNYKIIGIAN